MVERHRAVAGVAEKWQGLSTYLIWTKLRRFTIMACSNDLQTEVLMLGRSLREQ